MCKLSQAIHKKAVMSVQMDRRAELERWEQKLSDYFERVNFGAYVQLLQRPKKILWLNFLGGIGRGVGIGVGFTIIAALIVVILQQVSVWNLPVIGRYIADLVRIVQAELHTPTV